jgi:hemerythrin-like domain-containing protein
VLTSALETAHHVLNALEAQTFEALGAGDIPRARALFRAFEKGADSHMRSEEELLFPVFEMRARLPHGGPTSVLRSEHGRIRELLRELAREIESGGNDAEALRAALRSTVADHHRKEETILYPWTERLLTDGEVDRLLAQARGFVGEGRPGSR